MKLNYCLSKDGRRYIWTGPATEVEQTNGQKIERPVEVGLDFHSGLRDNIQEDCRRYRRFKGLTHKLIVAGCNSRDAENWARTIIVREWDKNREKAPLFYQNLLDRITTSPQQDRISCPA